MVDCCGCDGGVGIGWFLVILVVLSGGGGGGGTWYRR